jgi:hypothetical protein
VRTRPAGKRLPGLREAAGRLWGRHFASLADGVVVLKNALPHLLNAHQLDKKSTSMVCHPPAPSGRWKPAAAAKVARRGAATNEACGRADPTTPARSAGRRGRARAAWGWQCRAAGPAGCRTFPWQIARARAPARARQKGIRTKLLRFLDFRSGKQLVTGRQSRIGNDFRHQRGSGRTRLVRWVHDTFSSRATAPAPARIQSKRNIGTSRLYGLKRQERGTRQLERRPVWVDSGPPDLAACDVHMAQKRSFTGKLRL